MHFSRRFQVETMESENQCVSLVSVYACETVWRQCLHQNDKKKKTYRIIHNAHIRNNACLENSETKRAQSQLKILSVCGNSASLWVYYDLWLWLFELISSTEKENLSLQATFDQCWERILCCYKLLLCPVLLVGCHFSSIYVTKHVPLKELAVTSYQQSVLC